MIKEEWRAVIGLEGKYEVSNLGNIRSVDHYGFSKGHKSKRLFKGKMLKPFTKKNTDYKRVSLWDGEKQVKHYVHYYVATAFPEICGEPFEGAQIDHLNGCASDNRAVNLKFKTHSDNIRNPITYKRNLPKWLEYLKKTRTPEAIEKAVKSKSRSVMCIETGKTYCSRFLAAESTGSNPDSIWQCCSGKKKSTISPSGKLHWVFV